MHTYLLTHKLLPRVVALLHDQFPQYSIEYSINNYVVHILGCLKLNMCVYIRIGPTVYSYA